MILHKNIVVLAGVRLSKSLLHLFNELCFEDSSKCLCNPKNSNAHMKTANVAL